MSFRETTLIDKRASFPEGGKAMDDVVSYGTVLYFPVAFDDPNAVVSLKDASGKEYVVSPGLKIDEQGFRCFTLTEAIPEGAKFSGTIAVKGNEHPFGGVSIKLPPQLVERPGYSSPHGTSKSSRKSSLWILILLMVGVVTIASVFLFEGDGVENPQSEPALPPVKWLPGFHPTGAKNQSSTEPSGKQDNPDKSKPSDNSDKSKSSDNSDKPKSSDNSDKPKSSDNQNSLNTSQPTPGSEVSAEAERLRREEEDRKWAEAKERLEGTGGNNPMKPTDGVQTTDGGNNHDADPNMGQATEGGNNIDADPNKGQSTDGGNNIDADPNKGQATDGGNKPVKPTGGKIAEDLQERARKASEEARRNKAEANETHVKNLIAQARVHEAEIQKAAKNIATAEDLDLDKLNAIIGKVQRNSEKINKLVDEANPTTNKYNELVDIQKEVIKYHSAATDLKTMRESLIELNKVETNQEEREKLRKAGLKAYENYFKKDESERVLIRQFGQLKKELEKVQ